MVKMYLHRMQLYSIEIYGDVYDTLEKEYGYYMKSYWEDETGIGIGPLIV